MREEKKYLVEEVVSHLEKSDYVFLADFQRVTVAETAHIRKGLAAQQAEFHVVKNSILNIALKAINRPDMSAHLQGQTAIIVGGQNPSEVAKVLVEFNKQKDKAHLKAGALGDTPLSSEAIIELSKLPSLDVMRAQLLSLFNTPAQQVVRVMQAIPEGVLNVLQAHSQKAA